MLGFTKLRLPLPPKTTNVRMQDLQRQNLYTPYSLLIPLSYRSHTSLILRSKASHTYRVEQGHEKEGKRLCLRQLSTCRNHREAFHY